MKATLTPAALRAVVSAPVSESKSDRNFRLSHQAAKSVENFLANKHTLVREVFDPKVLAAFTAAPVVGQITVGNIGIAGSVIKVPLSVVKVVDGRLMLQGIVPSAAGRFRTFDCGKAE